MLKTDFRQCSIGDSLAPGSFNPPDGPEALGGPILSVKTSYGAQTFAGGFIHTYTRAAKGAAWVRTS